MHVYMCVYAYVVAHFGKYYKYTFEYLDDI